MTEARKKWIRGQSRFKGISDGKKIPLSSFRIYGGERELIVQAYEAGFDGTQTGRLEKELAAYMGLNYAASLSSGEAALHMALKLAAERLYGSSTGILTPDGLGRGGSLRGKRVFCSDLTTADTVSPIVLEGGEPVFIDSSEGPDWSMDPEVLELAFGKYPDVKIVVMNHVYGFPGQALKIRKICDANGALLIEWAGEAIGAEYRTGQDGNRPDEAECREGQDGTDSAVGAEHQTGQNEANRSDKAGCREIPDRKGGAWGKVGVLGDYCVLDFEKGRMIGPSGGALLTRDSYSAEKARYWAAGAKASAPWNQHEELGCSCGMDELSAAVIRGQLQHIDEIMKRKKEIYDRYLEKLDDSMACLISSSDESRPNCWITAMTCESNIQFRETRNDRLYTYEDIHGTAAPMEIYEALEAFHVESRPVYKPMSMQPVFRNYEHFTLDGSWRMYENFRNDTFWVRCDMARQYYENGICLPSDAGMTQEEQDRVIEIVCACYSGAEMDRMAWV